MKDYQLILLGYTQPGHTNHFPWLRWYDVYKHNGYDVVWCEVNNIPKNKKKKIFITWNNPTSKELVDMGIYKKGDIILQKLTSLSKYDGSVDWDPGYNNTLNFFKKWKWTLYKMVEDLLDKNINIYAFGAKTQSVEFPEKNRIVKKLESLNRLFWIPFGSSLYSYDEIINAKPIMNNLINDIGFVGSKWGNTGRGNVYSWDKYLQPLITNNKNCEIKGGIGHYVNDEQHKNILKNSKLCPIVNATTWEVEKGVQDRFWTVFTSGRFGVVDSLGIYDFFNEDEVVCAIDKDEYYDKSMYYLKNVDKQLPFIEKVQKRIKNEYNYYITWEKIIDKLK